MKRLIGVGLLLVLLCTGPFVVSANQGGPSGHPAGCSSCHVPHDAQGDRLWPTHLVWKRRRVLNFLPVQLSVIAAMMGPLLS